LIGGSVIAGAQLVSKHVPGEYAALIGGLPTGIIASFFMASNSTKRGYFHGYIYTSLMLTLAILFIIFMIKRKPEMNINHIALIGLVFWAIISYIIIFKIVKKKSHI
jgi:hypothetical protein